MFQQEESGVSLPGRNGQILTLGLGLLATALAAAYVARLAKVINSPHRIVFSVSRAPRLWFAPKKKFVCGSSSDCSLPTGLISVKNLIKFINKQIGKFHARLIISEFLTTQVSMLVTLI